MDYNISYLAFRDIGGVSCLSSGLSCHFFNLVVALYVFRVSLLAFDQQLVSCHPRFYLFHSSSTFHPFRFADFSVFNSLEPPTTVVESAIPAMIASLVVQKDSPNDLNLCILLHFPFTLILHTLRLLKGFTSSACHFTFRFFGLGRSAMGRCCSLTAYGGRICFQLWLVFTSSALGRAALRWS